MTVHRHVVLGWDHPALPTRVIGTYRTRLGARIAAWWHQLGEWDAHAWVEDRGDPRRDLRYDPLAIGEDGPCLGRRP